MNAAETVIVKKVALTPGSNALDTVDNEAFGPGYGHQVNFGAESGGQHSSKL